MSFENAPPAVSASESFFVESFFAVESFRAESLPDVSSPCSPFSALAGVATNVRRLSGEPALLHDRVESRKHLFERLRLVGDLELEEGALLYDGHGALWVVDARQLDNDLAVAALLNDRLGDTELVDAGSDDLDGAIERLGSIRHRAFRLIDLEREVHSALEIQPSLQRDSRDGVEDISVAALHSLDHLAREQRPCGRRQQHNDEQHAVLQVGHATAGGRVGFGKL